MGKLEKLFVKIMCGTSDRDISFDELCKVLEYFGFQCRIRGSHHIFYKEGIEEIMNLQPVGSNAKAYQVKQVRNVILKYRLGDDIDV